MKLEVGEEITLNNNDKYIVMNAIAYQNKDYVFLMNNDENLVIKVAEQVIDNDDVFIKLVKDKKIIKKLLEKISGEKISA